MFYWKHSDYLVIGDYFSKYLIVRKLPSSTGSAVCKEILNIITQLGKPYIIRSDNGPCCTSTEFKELMKLLQIQHITSSPHFPQSNGFAEAMVKIAKKLLDCSTLQKKPWNFGLMEYRCTPFTANIPSPLELLTGCKPQMNLTSMPQDIFNQKRISQSYYQETAKGHFRRTPHFNLWIRTNSMVLQYHWQNMETCHDSRTSPQTSFILVQDGRLNSKTMKNTTSHQTMSKYD